MKKIFVILAIACLGSIAMSQENTNATTTTTTNNPSMTEKTGPTDAQIAAIVVAANTADIDAAKVAKAHTKNREVKNFAKTMIRDHSAVNKKAMALVKKLHVKPEPSATSADLKKGAAENIANLKTLKGHDFDKAYAEHEVAYHQQVLDEIDKDLIPSAKNPQLKSLLEETRPAVAAHLEHAKNMVATLDKTSGQK